MTGWNLPPGVTGREPVFGPDWEGPMEVECGQECATVIFTNALGIDLANLRGAVLAVDAAITADDVPRAELVRLSAVMNRAVARVDRAIQALPTVEDLTCEFAGEVDVAVSGGARDWVCPWCGNEHSEDLSEMDSDREYEEKGDR